MKIKNLFFIFFTSSIFSSDDSRLIITDQFLKICFATLKNIPYNIIGYKTTLSIAKIPKLEVIKSEIKEEERERVFRLHNNNILNLLRLTNEILYPAEKNERAQIVRNIKLFQLEEYKTKFKQLRLDLLNEFIQNDLPHYKERANNFNDFIFKVDIGNGQTFLQAVISKSAFLDLIHSPDIDYSGLFRFSCRLLNFANDRIAIDCDVNWTEDGKYSFESPIHSRMIRTHRDIQNLICCEQKKIDDYKVDLSQHKPLLMKFKDEFEKVDTEIAARIKGDLKFLEQEGHLQHTLEGYIKIFESKKMLSHRLCVLFKLQLEPAFKIQIAINNHKNNICGYRYYSSFPFRFKLLMYELSAVQDLLLDGKIIQDLAKYLVSLGYNCSSNFENVNDFIIFFAKSTLNLLEVVQFANVDKSVNEIYKDFKDTFKIMDYVNRLKAFAPDIDYVAIV